MFLVAEKLSSTSIDPPLLPAVVAPVKSNPSEQPSTHPTADTPKQPVNDPSWVTRFTASDIEECQNLVYSKTSSLLSLNTNSFGNLLGRRLATSSKYRNCIYLLFATLLLGVGAALRFLQVLWPSSGCIAVNMERDKFTFNAPVSCDVQSEVCNPDLEKYTAGLECKGSKLVNDVWNSIYMIGSECASDSFNKDHRLQTLLCPATRTRTATALCTDTSTKNLCTEVFMSGGCLTVATVFAIIALWIRLKRAKVTTSHNATKHTATNVYHYLKKALFTPVAENRDQNEGTSLNGVSNVPTLAGERKQGSPAEDTTTCNSKNSAIDTKKGGLINAGFESETTSTNSLIPISDTSVEVGTSEWESETDSQTKPLLG